MKMAAKVVPERLSVIHLEEEDVYTEEYLDLGTAREDTEYEVPIRGGADFVFVRDIDGTAYVKFGSKRAKKLLLTKVRVFKFSPARFKKYYVTNTAQSGKVLYLWIGGEASFSVEALVTKVGMTDKLAADINPAEERTLVPAIEATGDLTGAAYSGTTSIADRFRLENVTIHFSAAVSPTVTITLDSAKGAAYDTVLRTSTLAAATDYVAAFGSGYEYDTNDEIKVDITAVAATHGTVVRISKGGKT